MRTSLIAVLFLVFALAFATKALIAANPEPVLDTSGKKLLAGVKYYILPVNEPDTFLTASLYGNDSCPFFVVKETSPGTTFKGHAATFLPIGPDDKVIRTSINLNIKFPKILSRCQNSMVWRLIKRISEAELIGLDGVEGNPGLNTIVNWFKIEKADRGYRLVFCPTEVCHCSVVCSELGVFVGEDKKNYLALSNPDQLQPLRVKFQRTEEEEACSE